MNKRNEEPLYIDVCAMLANEAGFAVMAIVMDLITHVWWPTKQPFDFDATKLAACLSKKLPKRGYTTELFTNHAEEIKGFFTILPDGKWAPNPVYFSLSNGNPGSES